MNKFWNWLKRLFIKAEPVMVKLAPGAVIVAEAMDPKLTPEIVTAQNVIKTLEGATYAQNGH